MRFHGLSRELELIWHFANHNLSARYKGSGLGFIWSFAHPCILFFTYYVAFKFIIKTPFTESHTVSFAFAVFYWYWIAQCLSEAPIIFLINRHLLAKVPIKLSSLVGAAILSQGLHFTITILTLSIIAWVIVGSVPSILLILTAVFFSSIFFFSVYLILGILNVFYRDIQHLIANLITPLFFFTPVVYDFESLKPEIKTLLFGNPLTAYTLVFKASVVRSPEILTYVILVIIWTLIFVLLAIVVVRCYRKSLLDRL
ncbi:MAG: ABC transporter permease [Deltaproteobacteria bacterium]|nr:ABC transporter permease [Deltaproteobacteria bacterium]